MNTGDIYSTGKNLLKNYADRLEDADTAEDDNIMYHLGKTARWLDDPEVKEVIDNYRHETDFDELSFAALMIEEDYESAAALSGKDADRLDVKFTEEALTLRKKRFEYDLPMPSNNEDDEFRKAFMTVSRGAHNLWNGETDEIYLDELLPAAEKVLEDRR